MIQINSIFDSQSLKQLSIYLHKYHKDSYLSCFSFIGGYIIDMSISCVHINLKL